MDGVYLTILKSEEHGLGALTYSDPFCIVLIRCCYNTVLERQFKIAGCEANVLHLQEGEGLIPRLEHDRTSRTAINLKQRLTLFRLSAIVDVLAPQVSYLIEDSTRTSGVMHYLHTERYKGYATTVIFAPYFN